MTNREIFDKVKAHLLAQNAKAQYLYGPDSYQCRYKDPHGRKCAVGCLIPDDQYDSSMECQDVYVLYDNYGVLKGLDIARSQVRFLEQLRIIHDNYDPILWEEYLNNLENSHLWF